MSIKHFNTKSSSRILYFFILLITTIAISGIAPDKSIASPTCTTTWTGADPLIKTWNVPNNWSTNTVPTSSDTVCIGTGATVKVTTGANIAKSIQAPQARIEMSGGTLTIDDNSNEESELQELFLSGGTLENKNKLKYRVC